MKFASLLFGPSVTKAPLPEFYPLYALRFRSASRWLLKALFRRVVLFENSVDRQLLSRSDKIVLYANHPSFWDPLLLALATGRLWPDRPVLAAIDSQGLRRHPYFHGLGFFAVDPASVAGLRRLSEVARQSLTGSFPCCLVLTPEGRFSPPGVRPLKLKRGLARILADHTGSSVTVLPIALAYRGRFRGEAGLTLGQPLTIEGAARHRLCPRELHVELSHRLESALNGLHSQLDSHDLGINLLQASSR